VKKKLLPVIAIALICAGYSALAGFLSIGSNSQPDFTVDELPYQNFSIAAGAGIGLAVFGIAYARYRLLKRKGKTESWGFFIRFNLVTGIILGFASSFIVHISAAGFGLINAPMVQIILESGIAAFLGGCLGFAIAMVLNESG
jgi:hypothetical protein